MVTPIAKSRNAETRPSCCPRQMDFSGTGRHERACRVRYRSLLQGVLQRRFDALLQARSWRLRPIYWAAGLIKTASEQADSLVNMTWVKAPETGMGVDWLIKGWGG